MKEFNKDRELNKLKLKHNKGKYIKYGSIILSVLILLVGIIYFTFAKFESNKSYTLIQGKVNYSPSDVDLVAYYYDNDKHDMPPTKDNGYIIKSVNCDNADGSWSNKSWSLNISNITGKVKCTLEFEQGEDTSVTPITYGKIIDLGEGTSFDIKTLAPDVDYTTLTVDNFIVEVVDGSGTLSYTAAARIDKSDNGGKYNANCSSNGSISIKLNKDYSDGVLTSNGVANGSVSCNYYVSHNLYNGGSSSGNVSVPVHAYLVLN